MDTTHLVVDIDAGLPGWVAEAARGGIRIALELLRSERLPECARVVNEPCALAALGQPSEADAVTAHDDTTIVIAYQALIRPDYIGCSSPGRDVISHTVAFCAGFEAALFAADAYEWGEVEWTEDVESDDPLHAAASAVATIASEFSMVSAEAGADRQSAAVRFLLARLARLREKEGAAALWRGAVGRAVRALVREVRFSDMPGRVSPFGERLYRPTDVIRLVDYAAGLAAWPFPATRA